ncbi:hypothetical protein GQ600_24096 [Phytophthora cactorum]|nr:hypothetical protein GQ600_24096 [Phytophthora cactorum]
MLECQPKTESIVKTYHPVARPNSV